MKQNEIAIEVISMEKSYKEFKVLKGVNFTVKKGGIFALLGSNGAGKTTTVKILSTLLKADRGSVNVLGFDLEKEAQNVREQISLTGQYAAVDENLTGRENMRMIASLRHITDIKNTADEYLRKFDLANSANKRVSAYSGGMRRRLDLAMSLIGKPQIIFLDEPTTGLDPQSRLAMWKIVKELSISGTTIFLTTQYLEEAEQLADYIAILNDGIIAAEGTVEELKKLVPSGVIEFIFYNIEDMQKSYLLLRDYNVTLNSELQTLSVSTGDGIEQLSDILSILKNNDISVSRFEQKLPTLEDVFLTLIGEKAVKELNKDEKN